jgi:hypothetical protein
MAETAGTSGATPWVTQGAPLYALRVVAAALAKDQFGRAALGIGYEVSLCVDDFQEEVAMRKVTDMVLGR